MLLACNRCWSLRKNCCGIIINNINDVPRHDNYSLFLGRRKLLSSSISLSSDGDVVSSYPISISRFSIQLRIFFFTGFMIKQPNFRVFVPFSVPLFQFQFWMFIFFFTFLLYCNKIINYSALFLVCCLFDGVYRRSVTSGTKDLLQVICKCSPTATRRMLLASFFLFLGYHPPSRYLSGRHHQLSLLILALILFSYNPIHFCSKTKTNYCIYLLKKLFLVKRLGN